MKNLQENILIAFTRPADERLVREHLSSFGYKVLPVSKAERSSVDLVLLDAASAARCGMEFLKSLKACDPVFLPIIVALDAKDSAVGWLSSGVVDDCLRLPLSKAELISRINVFLRLRHQTSALTEKSKEVQALVDSSQDHIFMLNEKGVFIASNSRVRHLGWKHGQDLVGHRLEEIMPVDIAGLFRKECAETLHTEQVRTLEYSLSEDSTMLYRQVTLFPVKLVDGSKRVGGVCRDITTLVTTEKDRFLLAKAMEYAVESVIITDWDKNIIFVNTGFEKISGYSRKEVLGKKPKILSSGRHEVSFYRDMHKTIYSGRTWKGDIINRRKDGRQYVVEATISPVFDQQDNISHFVSVRRDVTGERKFEKVRERMQRLEAIGTLAGGISHDFNNILTPIMGYTELCKRSVQPDCQLQEDLDQILLAANRAKKLVRQILSFSREAKDEKVPLDISLVAKEALKLIRAALPADIHIRQEIETGGECILADPTEIHQVIMNLCTNAHHAMAEKGGTLTVTLQAIDIDQEAAVSHPGLYPGRHLLLAVADTGSGIPEEIVDRIFEPYFTTREEERGTGLGLATVHGIVTGSSGALTVESEPQQGTVFKLYFPVVSSPGQRREKDVAVPIRGGNERILFVDDEPTIAEMGKQMLSRLGYDVQAMTDPTAALALVRNNPEAFDLLITDMTMPGLTGERLAWEVHLLCPDIPVILCTGFSHKMSKARARKSGFSKFLMKPIGFDELAGAVRGVLEGSV